MAITRQGNWLPQMRVDIPHIRALESAVVNDFDLLAGNILAGNRSYVVRGFRIAFNGPTKADNLQLIVAGSVIVHPRASEHGSIFSVPEDRAPEPLNALNPKVTGSFIANSRNYVSLDLRRFADASTADTVKFLDPDTNRETAKTVPIGRILDYRLYISTQNFAVSPHLLPIAIVTTDAENHVTKAEDIQDARPMLYRLATGGDVPNVRSTFGWASRLDVPNGVFSGGDKDIGSQKDWMDAVMTRLWELGGGENWFSATSDRDVKVAYGADVLPDNANNFYWDETNQKLKWRGITILFANSTATYNVVADSDPNGIDFPDGYCLYVDIKRDVEGAVVVPVAKPFDANLGQPTIPGSRFLLAWRKDSGGLVKIYTRDREYEVGRSADVASVSTAGVVKLYRDALVPSEPRALVDSMLGTANGVATLDATMRVLQTATAGNWVVNGELLPNLHNAFDVGSDAVRWRNGYFEGHLLTHGSLSVGQDVQADGDLTIGGSGSFDGDVETSNVSATNGTFTGEVETSNVSISPARVKAVVFGPKYFDPSERFEPGDPEAPRYDNHGLYMGIIPFTCRIEVPALPYGALFKSFGVSGFFRKTVGDTTSGHRTFTLISKVYSVTLDSQPMLMYLRWHVRDLTAPVGSVERFAATSGVGPVIEPFAGGSFSTTARPGYLLFTLDEPVRIGPERISIEMELLIDGTTGIVGEWETFIQSLLIEYTYDSLDSA